MISLDELCGILDSLEIPWANEGFTQSEQPKPPYIVLEASFDDTLYADNKAYSRWMTYDILLYTRTRDYALEKRISDALDKASCNHSLAITRYDGENLTEADYTVNVTEEEDQ